MAFVKQNPKIPEGINASQDHPLKEFTALLVGVVLLLAMAVAVLAVGARWLAPVIPFSIEQRLAGGYINAGQPVDSASSDADLQAADSALQVLGTRLAEQSQLPDGMTLHFHLLRADFPNAFATLGGHIFVTTALLQEVSSENALAMVLAHEIAHVKYRHPLQSMSSGLVVQFFLGVVLGGQGSSSLQAVLGQTGALTLLSFSRDMERESDAEALRVLTREYGTLAGADEFFRRMSEHETSANWREVFETHPDVDERIDTIGRAMATADAGSSVLTALDKRLAAL